MTTMRLDELLRGVAAPGPGNIMVSGLTLDSQAVRAGDAFVALAGAKHHGIEFADAAVAQGAVAVLAEESGTGNRERSDRVLPWFTVPRSPLLLYG